MDPSKIEFLFGELPEGFDPDDPGQREALLAPETADFTDRLVGSVKLTLANEIAADDPPETWITARRLMDSGLGAEDVFNQLATTVATHMVENDGPDGGPFDRDRYLADLAALPLPGESEVAEIFVREVLNEPGIDAGELDRRVLARMDRSGVGLAVDRLLERVSDDLIRRGVLAGLPGDRMLHRPSLIETSVLTHRLTEVEWEAGYLQAGADLPHLHDPDGLRLAGSPGGVIEVGGAPNDPRWSVPEGFLERFQPGDTLAVTALPSGEVEVRALAAAPGVDGALVARIGRAYDTLVAEEALPVRLEDLILHLLDEDNATFRQPQAPMTELCAAAGLEVRGDCVARDPALWDNRRTLYRLAFSWARFDGDENRMAAAERVLEMSDRPDPSPAELKPVINELADPEFAEFVVDALERESDGDRELVAARDFALRLTRAAGAGLPAAVAHWFAALVSERAGSALVADAHLKLGLASGKDFPPLVERAAWYASDRGDASLALSLLRRLADPPPRAMATLSGFVRESRAGVGRNDPCWCGSGRKFKHCHLNQPEVVGLPDRVPWIWFKAAAYLHQAGGEGIQELERLAEIGAESDDDAAFEEAFSDPLLVDLVLTEGGWFEDFLLDRAPLLPDDEALLAQSWLLVPRTVYEIVGIRPGSGLTVRDLATGDRLEVRERTFSEQAVRGGLIGGRAVPDGESHQFIGGIFTVPPGREGEVLDLCAAADPESIYAWINALRRPPSLVTREGEPMVNCEAVWEVADEAEARRFLDEHFTAEDEGWVETHELGDDERIMRARLELEGEHLFVSALSEDRMDRVLDRLASGVGGKLSSQSREPVKPGRGKPGPALEDPLAGMDPAEAEDLMARLQQKMEERWLSEPVPALAGLTPRQAAEDPTRREMVERLLNSFDENQTPAGAITFRTERLRQELGLGQTD